MLSRRAINETHFYGIFDEYAFILLERSHVNSSGRTLAFLNPAYIIISMAFPSLQMQARKHRDFGPMTL